MTKKLKTKRICIRLDDETYDAYCVLGGAEFFRNLIMQQYQYFTEQQQESEQPEMYTNSDKQGLSILLAYICLLYIN